MRAYGTRRRLADRAMEGFLALCAFVVVLPLFLIFADLLAKGAGSLTLPLLTELPKPVGEEGGGIANGILGTLTLAGIAAAGAIPVAVMTGIYLSEFGRGRLASAVRFAVDTLAGVPSILMGLFGYALLVLPLGHFSAWAGAFSLGVIFVPVVVRTTEEMLRTVPRSVREAALALGIAHWKATLFIVVRAAAPGIVTGILLATARIAGETAPLLFTALGNQFWQSKLSQPIAAIPLQVFSYAISPYEEWHDKAWGGAVVLILLVLSVSVTARVLTREKK